MIWCHVIFFQFEVPDCFVTIISIHLVPYCTSLHLTLLQIINAFALLRGSTTHLTNYRVFLPTTQKSSPANAKLVSIVQRVSSIARMLYHKLRQQQPTASKVEKREAKARYRTKPPQFPRTLWQQPTQTRKFLSPHILCIASMPILWDEKKTQRLLVRLQRAE